MALLRAQVTAQIVSHPCFSSSKGFVHQLSSNSFIWVILKWQWRNTDLYRWVLSHDQIRVLGSSSLIPISSGIIQRSIASLCQCTTSSKLCHSGSFSHDLLKPGFLSPVCQKTQLRKVLAPSLPWKGSPHRDGNQAIQPWYWAREYQELLATVHRWIQLLNSHLVKIKCNIKDGWGLKGSKRK